jgi:MoaA/NifB/PqqE/SkfB family radical SAM enzyme
MTRIKGTMELEVFKDIVSQGKELGIRNVALFGFGEPLLDKNLNDKIAYCKELRLKTFITTNASLLGVRRANELLKTGLDGIRFSVHGLFLGYEKVHVGFKFDGIVRNIINFLLINKIKFDNRCKTSIVSIPMNKESVKDIRRFWERTQIDTIDIWEPHNWGAVKKYRKSTKPRLLTCGRPERGPVQIQQDLKVIPCCFLTNGELILGDLGKQSLREVLMGEPYQDLTQRHKLGELKGLPCDKCDQRYVPKKSPLLYSTDKSFGVNKTSSTRFNLF